MRGNNKKTSEQMNKLSKHALSFMQLREARMETDANEGKESPLTWVSENQRTQDLKGSQPRRVGAEQSSHRERSAAPAKRRTLKVANDLIRPQKKKKGKV